jgi:hypothetical protein
VAKRRFTAKRRFVTTEVRDERGTRRRGWFFATDLPVTKSGEVLGE